MNTAPGTPGQVMWAWEAGHVVREDCMGNTVKFLCRSVYEAWEINQNRNTTGVAVLIPQVVESHDTSCAWQNLPLIKSAVKGICYMTTGKDNLDFKDQDQTWEDSLPCCSSLLYEPTDRRGIFAFRLACPKLQKQRTDRTSLLSHQTPVMLGCTCKLWHHCDLSSSPGSTSYSLWGLEQVLAHPNVSDLSCKTDRALIPVSRPGEHLLSQVACFTKHHFMLSRTIFEV